MTSTFGQLAGERLGRVYGGGVLKFELGDARALPILSIPEDVGLIALEEVDAALRRGDRDRARTRADEALLAVTLGLGWQAAAEDLLYELQERRQARQSLRLVRPDPPPKVEAASAFDAAK